MPTQEINNILSSIDGSINTFVDGLPDAQKAIYDKVLTLVKQLDTDPGGNIKNNITNIRILTQLQSAIHDVVMTDDYKKRIGAFTKTFDDIAKLQNDYLSTIFDKFSPTPVLAEITQASMDYTMDSLGDAGLSNDLANEVKDVLKQNILSGAKFSDMADQLRTSIQGNDQVDGALVRYAKTYAIDSVNTFNASYNRQVTSDFGAVWYRYIGTNKDTTRPFCDALTHKNNGYFHISEIPGFLDGKVGTEDIPLYDKTGLPQGMKEGTNESTFFTNRGGWNCNHQIFPVSRLSVPKDLLAKYPDNKKAETEPPKSQQPAPAPAPTPKPIPIQPKPAPVQQPKPIQPKPIQQKPIQPKQVVPETIGISKQELIKNLTQKLNENKVDAKPTLNKILNNYSNALLDKFKTLYPNIDWSKINSNPSYKDIRIYIDPFIRDNMDELSKLYQITTQGTIGKINGFDKKPVIANQDEFNSIVNSNDYIEIRRGLVDTDNISAKNQIEQFKNGELFNGKGIFGDGTYFDYGSKIKDDDFGISTLYAHGKKENVFRAVMPKNANIITEKNTRYLDDYANMVALVDQKQKDTPEYDRGIIAIDNFEKQLKSYGIKDDVLTEVKNIVRNQNDATTSIRLNIGAFMTALGFDAIDVNRDDVIDVINDDGKRERIQFRAKYLVVLNRSKLIVEK